MFNCSSSSILAQLISLAIENCSVYCAVMVPAQIKLWELAGDKPDCKISPYAWRVRLTLALKGLQYESIPWRFTDKDAIKPFEKVGMYVTAMPISSTCELVLTPVLNSWLRPLSALVSLRCC